MGDAMKELQRRLFELARFYGGDPSLAYEAARMALDRASELYKQGPPYTLDGIERAREELP